MGSSVHGTFVAEGPKEHAHAQPIQARNGGRNMRRCILSLCPETYQTPPAIGAIGTIGNEGFGDSFFSSAFFALNRECNQHWCVTSATAVVYISHFNTTAVGMGFVVETSRAFSKRQCQWQQLLRPRHNSINTVCYVLCQ